MRYGYVNTDALAILAKDRMGAEGGVSRFFAMAQLSGGAGRQIFGQEGQ
jgi:hypothetical protein